MGISMASLQTLRASELSSGISLGKISVPVRLLGLLNSIQARFTRQR
jgi:hypothetical protein